MTAIEAATIEAPLLKEIERLRGALRRIVDLPKQMAEAHTAANTAVEIAREALESARGGRHVSNV